MQATLTFRLSSIGRLEALRRDLPLDRRQAVVTIPDVEIPAELEDQIWVNESGDPQFFASLVAETDHVARLGVEDFYGSPRRIKLLWLDEPLADAAEAEEWLQARIDWLRTEEERIKREEAEKSQKAAAQKAEYEAKILERCERELAEYEADPEKLIAYGCVQDHAFAPELVTRFRAVVARAQEIVGQREAAIKAERRQWIEAHGSDRLRRLAEEEIEHDAVYRDERLLHERHYWHWTKQLAGHWEDARNPPVEALKLLDNARAQLPEEERLAAQLVYWIDDDNNSRRYVVLHHYMGREIVYLAP